MSRRVCSAWGLALVVGVGLTGSTGLALAQAGAKKPASKGIALPEVQSWVLHNGLRVAYVGVHKSPVVAVQMWYRAGAKDDRDGRRGIARMFEQLMYQGSRHVRPNAHREFLAGVGGYSSGSSVQDATAFHNTVPASQFDFAVRLEAERMRNLEIRKQGVELARKVVKAQMRQAAERDPLKPALAAYRRVAYKVHPYKWEADIDAGEMSKITVKDVKEFYDTYYVPNNALLVVVGDVNKADVEAAANKWFGAIKPGKTPTRVAKKEPKQEKARREVFGKAAFGLVVQGYHIPEAKHPDIYALQVLSLILGVGNSSRLKTDLVAKKRVARDAGATAYINEDPGLFVSFAAFTDASGADKVEAALHRAVVDIQNRPPRQAELRRARNLIVSDFVFRLEPVTGLANQVGMSWVLTGDPGQVMRDVSAFERVTAADVARVAKTYLTEANSTTIVIPPR